MLETIREYASERVDARGEAPALAAIHAEHYLSLAEQAEGQTSEEATLRRLDDEYVNLRAALARFIGERNVDGAFRLICALADYWGIRDLDRSSEVRHHVESALATDAGESPALRSRVLAIASDCARFQGDRRSRTSFRRGEPRAVATARRCRRNRACAARAGRGRRGRGRSRRIRCALRRSGRSRACSRAGRRRFSSQISATTHFCTATTSARACSPTRPPTSSEPGGEEGGARLLARAIAPRQHSFSAVRARPGSSSGKPSTSPGASAPRM